MQVIYGMQEKEITGSINLDYFDISLSLLAEGKHEAEEYHISGNKSEDKQYEIKDNGGGIYSENKYATIWNTLTGEEHEYWGINVCTAWW